MKGSAPSLVKATQVKQHIAIDVPYRAMLVAHQVDGFIRKVERGLSLDTSFSVKLNTKGEPGLFSDQAGIELRRLLKAGAATLPIRHQKWQFSPRVLLFSKVSVKHAFEYFQDADLVDTFDNLVGMVKRLQRFAKDLSDRCQSKRHRAKLHRHTKASGKNYRGACLLVDHLFKTHRRGLRVIRLDLSYRRKTQLCEFDRPLSVEEVFAHRASFIEDLPSLLHDNALAGYIWKTEFKPAKGFHHHFLIFVDAKTLRKDVSIAWILGEHWVKSITDQRGIYENVNAEYLGRQDESTTYVGLIRPSDLKRIENLKRIGVEYLCKHDHLIRWVMPEGHRAFGKTERKRQGKAG